LQSETILSVLSAGRMSKSEDDGQKFMLNLNLNKLKLRLKIIFSFFDQRYYVELSLFTDILLRRARWRIRFSRYVGTITNYRLLEKHEGQKSRRLLRGRIRKSEKV
jgi:hypothetical protein